MERLGPDAWAYVVLLVVLLIAAVTDVRTGKIYNWLTYPAMLVGLIGHAMAGGLIGSPGGVDAPARMGLMGSALGLAVGMGPLLLAWLAGGIGGGDAKIMGAVGALGGWTFAISALFFGLIVALVMAVGIVLRRRVARETLLRVGRFLALTALRTRPADPGTENSPRLAFGLALCIGAMIVLGLSVWGGSTTQLYLPGLM
jgi:prepilin peptidase CpaA